MGIAAGHHIQRSGDHRKDGLLQHIGDLVQEEGDLIAAEDLLHQTGIPVKAAGDHLDIPEAEALLPRQPQDL